jgi:NAD(P)-dependent dehydrogenase (short-subunit alcohol dehydrogenase family)
MNSDLSGSTALVTGSTSGIGAAIATALADRGAHVMVSGRDAERGNVVVAQIRATGGQADFLYADDKGPSPVAPRRFLGAMPGYHLTRDFPMAKRPS